MCTSPISYVCTKCDTSVDEAFYKGQACGKCGKTLTVKINDVDAVAQRFRAVLADDKPSLELQLCLPNILKKVQEGDAQMACDMCKAATNDYNDKLLLKDISVWKDIPFMPVKSMLQYNLWYIVRLLVCTFGIVIGITTNSMPFTLFYFTILVSGTMVFITQCLHRRMQLRNMEVRKILQEALETRINTLMEKFG